MSEMIERVARAMATQYDSTAPFDGATFLPMARAAIEAMREPAEAITDAAWNNDEVGLFGAKSVWTTMIDAALA